MFEEFQEDQFDFDEDGLVHNSPYNYIQLGADLLYDRSVAIAWTDGAGTQLDIVMALVAKQYGQLQRGQHMDTDLFVAVLGSGAFGFDVLGGEKKHASYVGEKLNLGREVTPTTQGLADLLNGVAAELVPGYGKAGDE